MFQFEITQSQYYNNENNFNVDNVMRANLWFEFFDRLF